MSVQEYLTPFLITEDDELIKRGSLSSFGVSHEVKRLVFRLKRKDYYFPKLPYGYTWDIDRASRFIDTLLRNEPTPPIFLYHDQNNRYLVLDGQQRLETIRRFYHGRFGSSEDATPIFRLPNYDDIMYKGLTYSELPEDAKARLDEYQVHTISFEQPPDVGDPDAIFRVFARLNTGNTARTAEELRVALVSSKQNGHNPAVVR